MCQVSILSNLNVIIIPWVKICEVVALMSAGDIVAKFAGKYFCL